MWWTRRAFYLVFFMQTKTEKHIRVSHFIRHLREWTIRGLNATENQTSASCKQNSMGSIRWHNAVCTEKTSIPFLFKLNGIWSCGQFSFRFPEPNEIPFCSENRKENFHHDHIPFNLKGNGNLVSENRTDRSSPSVPYYNDITPGAFRRDGGQ